MLLMSELSYTYPMVDTTSTLERRELLMLSRGLLKPTSLTMLDRRLLVWSQQLMLEV